MNGSLPSWVQGIALVGLPGLIAIYPLGMIPGLPSPIGTLNASVQSLGEAVNLHDRHTLESQRIQRQICRGVWKGNQEMQDQCGP